MDRAVNYHLGKEIVDKVRLTGGYTFHTWLLTLSGNQKVVFRHQRDFETGGGREISIADILEREMFFYSNVNKKVENICPEVYAVDGTREYHEDSFCIMEYIEGTPLNQCFDDFDEKAKRDILYQIGEIAARINGIEIDSNHPYVTNRGSWEIFMANRMRDRFKPLIHNKVITQDEVEIITARMCGKKANKTLSFLHLDMRRINMIYRDGNIFILDAENCEFGDPLFELAVIDCGGELDQPLIDGYKNAYDRSIDIGDELYYFYKMERVALVLHVFLNEVKGEPELARIYLNTFNELKERLTR